MCYVTILSAQSADARHHRKLDSRFRLHTHGAVRRVASFLSAKGSMERWRRRLSGRRFELSEAVGCTAGKMYSFLRDLKICDIKSLATPVLGVRTYLPKYRTHYPTKWAVALGTVGHVGLERWPRWSWRLEASAGSGGAGGVIGSGSAFCGISRRRLGT